MTRACCESPAPTNDTHQETHPPVGFAPDPARRDPVRVALAGNPNAGKSTLFNALTGAHQHVGNWPGKTVEKREGRTEAGDVSLLVVDLPGTYSLSAYSAEELVAMDYLLDARPDVVVAVVDAGNLERNLYLTVQIIEMGLPVVVALNMMDAAAARGLRIDIARLSAGLGGVPVVSTVAHREQGLPALKEAVLGAAGQPAPGPIVSYGPLVEQEIAALAACAETFPAIAHRFDPHWLAVRLLEGDARIAARLAGLDGAEDLLAAAQASSRHLTQAAGDDPDIVLADCRYGFINALAREVIDRPPRADHTPSDRIDRIVTHPLWGLPIFMAIMWIVFNMTSRVSTHYVDWIDSVIGGPLSRWAAALLSLAGLGGTWVESLVVDGILAGVGGVLVFVPVLAMMYFFIAILEDSGYMARAAFLMDRWMRLLGLHGKSFIPMLLGFGCNVPGVIATRTLEDPRDRLLTALLVPFMSCGARLPVFMVIGAALFGAQAGTLVFAMYVLGVVAAIGIGLLLRSTLFRTDEALPFVIELPPYRQPSLKGILIHTWERTRGFIRNATTVILAASVVVWLLVSIPVADPAGARFAAVDADHSGLSALSRWLAPAFRPAGFGTWQAASSLVTGFVAKEVIVSTLSVVYTGSDEASVPAPGDAAPSLWADLREIGAGFMRATWDTLRAALSLLPGIDVLPAAADPADPALLRALRGAFTPLSAVAFCMFVLLTAPCVTTMAALRREFGLRWTAFSVGMMLVIAWAAAVITYQGGLLLQLAATF